MFSLPFIKVCKEIVYKIKSKVNNFRQNVFNINVVLVTMLLYFFVFIITTLGSIFTLKNTKPIEVLKEVE